MARHHMINGEKVMFTAEEEAQRDAEEKKWAGAKHPRARSLASANSATVYWQRQIRLQPKLLRLADLSLIRGRFTVRPLENSPALLTTLVSSLLI